MVRVKQMKILFIYPVTTHDIVNVVAKLSRTNTDTGTEAKFIM